MQPGPVFRPGFRWLLAITLLALSLTRTAGATPANTDVSDIWWNPAESGWGMQLVNTGTFVFATLYVYNQNGTPLWATGQLNKTAANPPTFTGPLLLTTGPYFGGAFNPGAVTARQAGTMTFVLTGDSTGTLSYSIDGVAVSKAVQRQPLTMNDYTGVYAGFIAQAVSCPDPANNFNTVFPALLEISHTGSAMTVVQTEEDGYTCTLTGNYSQLGRLGTFQSTYACSNGATGTMSFSAASITPGGFSARLQSHDNGSNCDSSGWINGMGE